MTAHNFFARRRVLPLLAALTLLWSPRFTEGSPQTASKDRAAAKKVEKKIEKLRSRVKEDKKARKALEDFQEELDDYAELHEKELKKVGVQESVANRKTLADAIADKRSKAKQGDIFQPEIEPLFRRLLAEQLEGPDAFAAKKAAVEGNPGEEKTEVSAPVLVRVNGLYPLGASLSTVPPSVLLTLPELPKCLEYRFVERDLILLDSVAGLIVDFLPAITPPLSVK